MVAMTEMLKESFRPDIPAYLGGMIAAADYQAWFESGQKTMTNTQSTRLAMSTGYQRVSKQERWEHNRTGG